MKKYIQCLQEAATNEDMFVGDVLDNWNARKEAEIIEKAADLYAQQSNLHKHNVSGKLQDVIEDCLFDFKNEDQPLSVCVALILAACASAEGGQTGE